jgi:hypothetical protein
VRSSHNLQLAATAVASGLLVGSAILGLQKAKQEYRVSDLKSSIPDLDKDENVVQVCFVHLCEFFLSRRKSTDGKDLDKQFRWCCARCLEIVKGGRERYCLSYTSTIGRLRRRCVYPSTYTPNISNKTTTRPDPGTTSPQPRLPHRRWTQKTPQCLHHHRRRWRRRFARRSRSRQIRSWKTSHHRFRPSHSVVVEQTRCGYSRRRGNTESTLPPQTSGANHTMDAV